MCHRQTVLSAVLMFAVTFGAVPSHAQDNAKNDPDEARIEDLIRSSATIR
jgi:hypothetical protein